MNKKAIIGIIVGAIVLGGLGFASFTVFSNNKIEKKVEEANKLMNDGKYREALKECEAVLEKEPSNNKIKDMENIIAGYLRAEELYKKDELEKAKTVLDDLDGYNKYEIADSIDGLKKDIDSKEKEAETDKKSEETKKQETVKKQETTKKQEVAANRNSGLDKMQYIKELNQLKNVTDGYVNGMTQAAMNMQSGEVYTKWDNKLNEIWKVLEKTLPKDRMEVLRSKQVSWINQKEKTKKEIQKEYEGGSMMPLQVNSALANMTKERCYYLVENYIN